MEIDDTIPLLGMSKKKIEICKILLPRGLSTETTVRI